MPSAFITLTACSPLVRMDRRAPAIRAISWDYALDLMAEKFSRLARTSAIRLALLLLRHHGLIMRDGTTVCAM